MPLTNEGTAPVNVVQMDKVELQNNETLTLHGESGDYFVLNVQEKFFLNDQAAMVFTGGLTSNHIIVNLLPGSSELKLEKQARACGMFFAVHSSNKIELKDDAIFIGTVTGRDVMIDKNARIVHEPFD